MNSAAKSISFPPATVTNPAEWLRSAAERLRSAVCGTAELDILLACLDTILADSKATGQASQEPQKAAERMTAESATRLRCTTDLNDALILLPPDCNFSLGCRDGVFWAWSQPNDGWEPAPGEARHDHPGGSGLVVAQTAALAVTCTALVMHLRRLKPTK